MCSKYPYLALRIEICTNYALLAFSSLLRSIVLKQIRITPIQNLVKFFYSDDFSVISSSVNLAYQKCFVLQRLLYSDFIFTAILLNVHWMNLSVLVWIHFNVCKGDNEGLFTWSGEPRSSWVGFFCFHALGDTKQKKPTPLNRSPPLHVNRV